MDLKEYFRETEGRGPLEGARATRRSAAWRWRRLRWYQKPTIAMVNGWCFGGAFRPCSPVTWPSPPKRRQFGLSEINWGILPGGGATKVVVDLLSHARRHVPRPDRRD